MVAKGQMRVNMKALRAVVHGIILLCILAIDCQAQSDSSFKTGQSEPQRAISPPTPNAADQSPSPSPPTPERPKTQMVDPTTGKSELVQNTSQPKVEEREPPIVVASPATSDSIDRLVFTIIAGLIVLAIGIVVRRELLIFELYNLTQILKYQLDGVRTNPENLHSVISIGVDDLKPLARYMSPEEFLSVMRLAATVDRYYELNQEVLIAADESDAKVMKIRQEMRLLLQQVRIYTENNNGEFSLRSITHQNFILWARP
jgi:hypothetical protein